MLHPHVTHLARRALPSVATALARSRSVAAAALLVAAGCAGEAANGRPWVHHIDISGTKHVEKDDLKESIALSESPWISFLPRNYLDSPTLPVDKERIEAYYQAHGYFAAKVTRIAVTPRGDGKSVDVKFDVEEGPSSRVRSLSLSGLETLRPDEVKQATEALPLRPGETFVHQRYLETKGILEARLKDLGHAWAKIEGEALVDRAARQVDVVFHITPGPVAYFDGDVAIEGDSSVNPAWTRMRVPVRKGQRYDNDMLELTRGRIYQLGVYSSVKVDVVPHPGEPSIADLLIHVTPGKRNELRAGFGFGIEPQRYDFHVPVRYTRHNWLGRLRTLRLRFEPGWAWVPNPVSSTSNGPMLVVEAQVDQPDFLMRDLEFKNIVGYDLGVDYAFMYQGPRESIGLDRALLRDRLHLRLSYNFQYLTFFNTDPTFATDPKKARAYYGYSNPYRLAYLLGEVALDLRDQSLEPHKGAYVSLQGEAGADWLGGGFTYERVTPDARVYLPLGKRVVIAARAQYGHMFSSGSDQTPITRRLYLGGADSHRGFGYNRLAPQVASGTSLPPIPIGGIDLALGQLEVRTDVTRLYGNWFGLVAFYDVGDVPEAGRAIDFAKMHHAVGAGLRYHTLIGTLRADLGVRLNRVEAVEPDGRHNPDPGSRVAFHLSIGEAF